MFVIYDLKMFNNVIRRNIFTPFTVSKIKQYVAIKTVILESATVVRKIMVITNILKD